MTGEPPRADTGASPHADTGASPHAETNDSPRAETGEPPRAESDAFAALARLHAAAFAGRARGWAAREIADLARGPGGALVVEGAPPRGFALLRVAADEAELLTIAVEPAHQRRGLGAALLARAEAAAKARGAAAMLLEVEADAAPARALYARAGWRGVGLRRDYLGPGRDSLILRKQL